MQPIRVLIVDDSPFFRGFLQNTISGDPFFQVVGQAMHPYDARDKIVNLQPDIITMDIEMPQMNGVDFVRLLMQQWPIPVLVVSSARERALEVLRAGAIGFLQKPSDPSASQMELFQMELKKQLHNIGMATHTPKTKVQFNLPEGFVAPAKTAADSGARVPVLQSAASNQRPAGFPSVPSAGHGPARAPSVSTPPSGLPYRFQGIVAIGASTGGTQSTAQILKALPGDFPATVIVQHMPPEFTRMYAENLDRDCALHVREAKDGDEVVQGTVLIAPGDRHMTLQHRPGGSFSVHVYYDEKCNGHRPSVDVLFRSVAKVAGANAVGVILTGMGADGAAGLLEMRRQGAFTLGQDEKSCVVYGMPREAFLMGAVTKQWPLDMMSSALLRYVRDLIR